MSTDTITEAVADYRHAATALRGIDYRLRRGALGNGGTARAIKAHEAIQAGSVRVLLGHGRRDLVGHLMQENALAARISERKRNGVGSPDLKSRLAAARHALGRAS